MNSTNVSRTAKRRQSASLVTVRLLVQIFTAPADARSVGEN